MANNLKGYDANQVLRAVYDVDKNCLRTCLVDGGAGEGPAVEVIIDHSTDSIRLGDGTSLVTTTIFPASKVGLDVNILTEDVDIRPLDAQVDNVAIEDADGDQLAINADGSLNVAQALNPDLTGKVKYDEITSVASSSETTIVSFTALSGRDTFLQGVTVSGTNIAAFKVKVNGAVIDLKRTYFGGNLNEEFIFNGQNNSGVVISVGQTITVTVEHSRPMSGDFNSKILYMEAL